MAGEEYQQVRTALRSLPTEEQRQLAISMADLALPFATLSPRAQPEGGLAAVASIIRDDVADLVAIDAARHRLWSVPELREPEEPSGAAWYSLGATVAWIYAADARATAPSDGVANAFSRLADLLGGLDDELGDTSLMESMFRALATTGEGRREILASLLPDIEAAVRRLDASG